MHTAPEMNGRPRRPAAARGAKAAPQSDSRVMEKDPRKPATPVKGSANAGTRGTNRTMNRIQSRRERKLALQQDVDKLKKKLRHEENVHRALERAFTRPLGALPRLPPYLPSQTLALLAEVAVLEEEVVRLEEQVVNFRQGIYQEAIIFSSAKNTQLPGGEVPEPAQFIPSNPVLNSEVSPTTVSQGPDHAPNARPSPHNGVANGIGKHTPRKPVVNTTTSPSTSQDDRSGAGKENQSCSNTPSTSSRQTPPLQQKTATKPRATPPDRRVRATPAPQTNTAAAPGRKRPAAGSNSGKVTDDSSSSSSVPNKLSEELLRCLLTIFSQMSSAGGGGRGDEDQQAPSPSVSGSSQSSSSASGSEDAYPQDPYGVLELGARDIGPYKRFHVVDAASFDPNALAGDTPLGRRLKALLRRLSSVDLAGLSLSHQQKLAFWINVYNSCMMNAFLEQGIPTTPQMLVAMTPKATISVGGRTHSAMSIEHFILRLPYSAKQVDHRGEGAKGGDDDVTAAAAGAFGLEWPEPLVTFALSCGSWSSPAVRVYTAERVEEELEAAKREYLQAAVGVSAPGKLAVPKLLHWYLLDFAKDVDALMDWVCLQLPPELRHKAVRVVEDGRRRAGADPAAGRIHVLPYEFRFRYLLAS